MKLGKFSQWMVGLAACGATPTYAKDKIPSEIQQFAADESITLRPDRVYILIRLDTSLDRLFKLSANILRVPSVDEIDSYETARKTAYEKTGKKAGPFESFAFDYQGRANLYEINKSRKLQQANGFATVLVEAPIGSYILYGLGYGLGSECFCLGTVGFTPEPGKITDIGSLRFAYAWRPSDNPEFAEETGLGKSADMAVGLMAASLHPPSPEDLAHVTVAGVSPDKVVLTKFHAIGPFVDPNVNMINRLAAMPGVLAYRMGRVIDVATGKDITDTPHSASD